MAGVNGAVEAGGALGGYLTYLWILHFGIAFFNSVTPALVTLVPYKESNSRRQSPHLRLDRLGFLLLLVYKTNRVQIGVFQHKPQPNRLASELFDVRAALPRHYIFELVAVDLRTICQSMA